MGTEALRKIEIADFETAVRKAGYGRFQGALLVISGAIYASCAISTTTLSFVLPAAECDFELRSADKGKLSATPLIGMIFGSYLWGTLADLKGRKWVIVACLFLDAFAAFISSVVPNFYVFLVCRFFNGFGIIGATSLVFSYFGEFLSERHRDVMLCRLEVFWALGMVVLPGIAWLIIPQSFVLELSPTLTLKSWRIFVAICGMPSLTTALLLCIFPESPRFLLNKGRGERAHSILSSMYAFNTGRAKDNYPIVHLKSELENSINNNSIGSVINSISNLHELSVRLTTVWKEKKNLFSRPYIQYLCLTCFTDFGLMSSYYTLIMWFPDLFDRFNQYQATHVNEPTGICDVTTVVLGQNETEMFDRSLCDKPIDQKVFLYTMIVGASCIPTAISLGLCINKFGKKNLLIFSLIAAGLSALGLNWIRNSTQNLIVSCIFESITSMTEAVIFCVVVDLFPTSLRAVALSLTVTSGRIGAILSNVIFGLLVDLNCIIPIYTFGGLLILSGFLSFSIPKPVRLLP